MISATSVSVPVWPSSCLASTRCVLFVNNRPVLVHANPVSDFAYWECDGAVEVSLIFSNLVSHAEVQPTQLGIKPEVSANTVTFKLNGPRCVCLEVDGRPLYLYAYPFEAPQNTCNSDYITLPPGKVTDIGEFVLKSGQTLHIPAGAVARGYIRARSAKDITIRGRGILDGGLGSLPGFKRTIVLEDCSNVRVHDILMLNPQRWMLTFGRCEHVLVDGLRQLGEIYSTDGVDIVGSRHVVVQNCCLKNNDDCVVIKSLDLSIPAPGHSQDGDATMDWSQDVWDILVQDCILGTHQNGTAMEIGHELRCDSVSNIHFKNIDVLCVHRHGSVFGIHNADRALVTGVTWEKIFVEHHYDKLIDFRTVRSRWSEGDLRGRVEKVELKDITIRMRDYNYGYSSSLMGGFDSNHGIDDVILENFRHGSKLITDIGDPQLDLYLRHARNIRVKN